jgi:carboxypeptidase D
MFCRHVEVTPESNGNIFFWHFENQHIADRQRTVIWLNGGPGCSSEDGALMEIGPYRLKDSNTLEYNNGSWHEFANLLFVDNPVGTGFSYVNTNKYVSELDEMANQFVTFLEKWFALFPHYEHDDVSTQIPAQAAAAILTTLCYSFILPESPTPASISLT